MVKTMSFRAAGNHARVLDDDPRQPVKIRGSI